MEASSCSHGAGFSTPASDPALSGPCPSPGRAAGGRREEHLTKCWHLAGVGQSGDGPTPVLYRNTLPFGHAKSSRSPLPVEFSGKASRSPEGNRPESFEGSTEGGGTVSSTARQLLAGFVPLRLLARELPLFLPMWASPWGQLTIWGLVSFRASEGERANKTEVAVFVTYSQK